MITKGERYIGGGKLYFTPLLKNGTQGEEFEIGEIQEATLSISTETVDAISKDNVMQKVVEKVVKSIGGSLKFTTQKITDKNKTMALLGTSTEETFDIGDTLPDGTTATKQLTIPVIKVADNPLIEGQFRFVGDGDGEYKPVLLIYNASVIPSGDISYITDSFATLGFEGAVLETDEGYAKEYKMKVGE